MLCLRRKSTLRPILIMAILMLAVAGAMCYHQRGRVQQRTLLDHSIVRLCAGAKLAVASRFPDPRSIGIEGEAYIKVIARPTPLLITLHLMTLTVAGDAVVHVIARRNEPGEQVEVLFGDVTAQKNYPSPYTEPDHLGPGEMSMVNQTIDLMEKEKVDAQTMREMSDAFSLGQ